MCRILLQTKIGERKTQFEKALSMMRKGGPDASHILIENDIAFGHNRLAIIDTRVIADQPMMIDGNIILFNGEIYNHRALKTKYNLNTKSNSDTEVILMLYNQFKDEAFNMLDGEFAIVIYDAETETIKLVRDRLGIKQLYYSDHQGELTISSEIKAIGALIEDGLTIDSNSVDEWKCYGYLPDGYTLFNNVAKVLPNNVMEFELDGSLIGTSELENINYSDKEETLAQTITKAVGKRMMSDVPISCTLSGGIDSSIVAHLMSIIAKDPIKTYTIGFEGCENEFEQAKKVADFINSDHHQIEIPFSEVLSEIDEIIETMEEPIDRGSLIPTYFLAKTIKEKVTLIGEGSDEIFGGYSRHKWIYENPTSTFDEYFDSQLRSFPSLGGPYFAEDIEEDLNNVLKFDIENEIPNYHTVRIDKCMMHNGIEARVPFLDPEILTRHFNIPFADKQKPEKKCLREAFKEILPDWIINQPKKALKFPFHKIVTLPEVEKVIRQESEFFDIEKEDIDLLYKEINTKKNAARDLWNIFLFKKWEKKYIE